MSSESTTPSDDKTRRVECGLVLCAVGVLSIFVGIIYAIARPWPAGMPMLFFGVGLLIGAMAMLDGSNA